MEEAPPFLEPIADPDDPNDPDDPDDPDDPASTLPNTTFENSL